MFNHEQTDSVADEVSSSVWHPDCTCEVHLGATHTLRINWRDDCVVHGPDLPALRASIAAEALAPLSEEYHRFYNRIGVGS